ncbi:MAG: N-acetyltransferase [Thermoleophilia bacterium]|nr:N-acetyltransferase [Thermoleophilia bacterium]
MTQRDLPEGYTLDDDVSRIDVDAVHRFISTESYWGLGRARSVTELALAGSARMVGLYAPDGALVGFGRVISDTQTFAWLADVYVLEAHRGAGRGTALARELVDGSDFPQVRWILATRDAHDLYRKVGFGAPSDKIMERPTSG